MIFDEDLKFCASLLQKSDPQRFRSIMAAPEKLRPYYFVIFAFNVEISRAPYITKEPMIAEIRLQWWLDALDEIIGEKAVRKHFVATPLSKYIGKIQAKELKVLVNARKWDVYSNKFRNFSELKKYLFDTTVILFRVAAGCERGKNEKDFQNASIFVTKNVVGSYPTISPLPPEEGGLFSVALAVSLHLCKPPPFSQGILPFDVRTFLYSY